LEILLAEYDRKLNEHEQEFLKTRLETVNCIYVQQMEIWQMKARSVTGRILNLYMPHIRSIVRGKTGRDVEFSSKALVNWVDGYCFLGKCAFETYNEGEDMAASLDRYNREYLKGIKVRGGYRATVKYMKKILAVDDYYPLREMYKAVLLKSSRWPAYWPPRSTGGYILPHMST